MIAAAYTVLVMHNHRLAIPRLPADRQILESSLTPGESSASA